MCASGSACGASRRRVNPGGETNGAAEKKAADLCCVCLSLCVCVCVRYWVLGLEGSRSSRFLQN